MQIILELSNVSALESISIKKQLEKIVANFDKDNLGKIADLSAIPNANTKIKNLFNNPLFKMGLK